MGLPFIDFSDPLLRLAYVCRVDYLVGDQRKKLRIAGPREATGSGLRCDVEGLGYPCNWQGRGGVGSIDRDLGGLHSHVQHQPELTLEIDIGGPADPLLVDAQDGRWNGGEVRLWVVALDNHRRVVAAQERFRGRMDRDPQDVTNRSMKLVAVEGLVGVEERMPRYRFPDHVGPGDDHGWTVGDTAVIGVPGDTGYGNVVNQWHPGTYAAIPLGYASPPSWAGKEIGPVYGNAYGGDTCWRQLVCYGRNERPDVVSGVVYYFFVSPQFDCYVDEAWWEQTSAGVIRGAVDAPNTNTIHFIEAFNNRDPAMGPVGTCARLKTVDGYVDNFSFQPFDRLYAKVAGPGAGIPYATFYGGNIEALRRGAGVSLDAEVLEQLFTVDLGLPDAFGTGAVADWSSSAPNGATTANHYRRFHNNIPSNVGDEVPLVRDVVGELMALVESDLVQRFDPATGERRLYPKRRRPNPMSQGNGQDPDHIIEAAHLLSGHRAQRDAWVLRPDPDGYYSNDFRADGPTHSTHPLLSATDGVSNLTPSKKHSKVVKDELEQQGPQGVVTRTQKGKFWVHHEDTEHDAAHAHTHDLGNGFSDAITIIAGGRAQPQWTVEVEMGHRGFGVELMDVVRYNVSGLRVGDGHCRGVVEDLNRFTVRLTTYHATFFPEGRGGGYDDAHGARIEELETRADPN